MQFLLLWQLCGWRGRWFWQLLQLHVLRWRVLCRSVYGLFADLDSLHQRMLVSLRELNFSRWGG